MAEAAAHPLGAATRRGIVGNGLHALAVAFVALALAFAATAWWLDDTFFLRLATEALILAGLAVSVDILLGFTGLLSLGQALFFGLGAYVSALTLREVAPSFWLAMALTLAAATLAGVIGGFIAIRARGVYFALITFGLAQVVAKVVYNTRALGASDGLINIPLIDIELLAFRVHTADPLGFFLVLLVFVGGLYAGLSWLMDTPFGRTLQAIRANEKRLPFLGYDPQRYKLAAYVLAANVAALSGAFYPMLRGFVSPELMFFKASGNAVITAIIGGIGTLIGPIYASMILTVLRSVVGTFTEHHLIVIGALFMLAVLFMPQGLAGFLRPLIERGARR